MRLIDAEVLKKAVINNFDNLQAYFPKDFIEEIDNAPTIKTFKYCADEVEEASKRIGSRYYGPDICSKCAHRNDLMSKVRDEPSIFCEHWGLKVNSFDHCSNFEEVKHD